jgi:hypothetical protein
MDLVVCVCRRIRRSAYVGPADRLHEIVHMNVDVGCVTRVGIDSLVVAATENMHVHVDHPHNT